MPLTRVSPRGRFASAIAIAIVASATCRPHGAALAFDKQTCAVAYENAQQLRSKLKLRRARDQLLICGHSSCPSVVTKDCNAWLEELETELTSVVFRVRDARGQELSDVRVTMDGEHLRDRVDAFSVFVDPGMHVFRFDAEGSTPVEVRQMLRKGDRDRPIEVTLKLRADDRSDVEGALERSDGGRRSDADGKAPVEIQLVAPAPPAAVSQGPGVGTYVAGGIGVAALTSFAYFGLKANGEASYLRRTCAPSCDPGEVDSVRSELLVANISLGVGLVALGVAGAFWLVQGTSAPPPTSSLKFDVVPPARGHGAVMMATVSAP